MKKIISAVLFVFVLLSLTACADNSKNNSDGGSEEPTTESSVSEIVSGTQSENSDDTSSAESSEEQIRTISSSLSSPLGLNSWGIVAKYNTKEHNYINVPIRITAVEHGQKATDIVKKFMSESSSYNYTEPGQDAEWVVAEYEISLDGFPVDEGGADSSITSSVTAENGGYFEYGDKKWSTTTVNITDGQYYFEGTVKGQIAYQMLKNRTDYVITLGEYDETQAFFKE
ncbi:MAG: hypothetical protein PUG48_09415 [Clostridia bacterium]|nr:hypothetical protein [Clostridia bacterium]